MKVRIVLEIVGHPKEHVEEVIKKVIDKIKEDYKVLESQIAEVKEVKGNLFSTFFDGLIEFKDVQDLGEFCFNYMPSSVEIEEPANINMTNAQLNNIFNDIMAKLHVYDAMTKTLKAQNQVLDAKLKRALSEIQDKMKDLDNKESTS